MPNAEWQLLAELRNHHNYYFLFSNHLQWLRVLRSRYDRFICTVIQSHYDVHEHMQGACNDLTTHTANFPRFMRQTRIHNLCFGSIECEMSCSCHTDGRVRVVFGRWRHFLSFFCFLLSPSTSILKIIQSATFCSAKRAVERLAHANRIWYRWRRFMREWRSLQTQIDTSSRWGRRTEEKLSPGRREF